MPHPSSPSRLSVREAAETIVRRLQHAGHATYFAGGCVRDRLLGLEPSDYDLATSATPQEIKRLFPRTRAVGQHFGVMLVLRGEHQIEVATFRTDADYHDGRRPETVHFSTPQEDAQRRDFTINGLFYDPVQDRVVDYVGGQADLKAGLLRAIGHPPHRFAEDHLRLLRAVRFAARFDLAIEPVTWSAMQQMSGNLAGVSPERILEELEKIAEFKGVSTTAILTPDAKTAPHSKQARALQLIHDGGLLPSVMPEYVPFVPHLPLAVQILARLPIPCPPDLLLAGWLCTARNTPEQPPTTAEAAALQKLARQVGRRLRASNQLTDSLVWLLGHHGDLTCDLELADVRQLRADPRWPQLSALVLARQGLSHDPAPNVNQNLQKAACYPTARAATPPPLITGDLLLARGFSSGPALGKLLAEVYRAQLNETVHTVDEGLVMIAARI